MNISSLQKARYEYSPKLPGMLRNGISEICVQEGAETQSVADQEKIKALFPNTYGKKEITFVKGQNTSEAKTHRVGVILSGGQAPGGHNVICGLYDALKATNPENELYGFKGGPSGLIEDNYLIFTDEYIDQYRNTGGFDIIGSGRTKLETKEQFAIVSDVCKNHGITAVVIIGGDDSNTNAGVLAEYFAANNTGVQVIGCPKTIDGDLKNEDIECSFGFDTATKTYSELIGNIQRDCNSSKKYWHFIKVMGRSASHVALECALKTQPNVCLISEEVAAKKMSLSQIADQIADSVEYRSNNGENFGVVVIPEGVVEFVPEFGALIHEINELLAGSKADNWFLRQSPQVLGLQFVDDIKRADRDNAIDLYIGEDYMDVLAEGEWQRIFKVKPAVFTAEEKRAWLDKNTDVALGSDAFFPFGDNIERAHKSGVKYVAEPGGSIRDDHVIDTCNKYGMVMSFTGIRLFHH